jgi:hypothetical protein
MTVWAKANRASREPFTGITWVAASRQRHAVAAREPAAMAGAAHSACPERGGIVGQSGQVVASARLMKGGVSCCGSPIDSLISPKSAPATRRQRAGAAFRRGRAAGGRDRDSRRGEGWAQRKHYTRASSRSMAADFRYIRVSAFLRRARRTDMGHMIEFKRPDGSACAGYLASAGQGRPGVVVIQEWWGLNDQICGIADRFAARRLQRPGARPVQGPRHAGAGRGQPPDERPGFSRRHAPGHSRRRGPPARNG